MVRKLNQRHQNMLYEPLDMFKKAVSFLYREIGVLRPENHPEVYRKASIDSGFFSPRRKPIAAALFFETAQEPDVRMILRPYEEMTGLELDDIVLAFRDGKWASPSGRVFYGGPRWATIAKAVVALRDALLRGNEAEAEALTRRLGSLEHNNGPLVDKFSELETLRQRT